VLSSNIAEGGLGIALFGTVITNSKLSNIAAREIQAATLYPVFILLVDKTCILSTRYELGSFSVSQKANIGSGSPSRLL
jgi:hypothetical protein